MSGWSETEKVDILAPKGMFSAAGADVSFLQMAISLIECQRVQHPTAEPWPCSISPLDRETLGTL